MDILPFYLAENTCPPSLESINSTEEELQVDEVDHDEDWLNDPNNLSWAAFHAQREFHLNKFKEDISALLPICRDDSKYPATIQHVWRILRKAVLHLNSGQPIVTTLDQPLFAIAKRLQWFLPEFGTTNHIFVLGSLHVEMAMLSTLGDWFQGSGWLELLSVAKVTGTGNQAFLNGKEVSKTKYCHW